MTSLSSELSISRCSGSSHLEGSLNVKADFRSRHHPAQEAEVKWEWAVDEVVAATSMQSGPVPFQQRRRAVGRCPAKTNADDRRRSESIGPVGLGDPHLTATWALGPYQPLARTWAQFHMYERMKNVLKSCRQSFEVRNERNVRKT
eukprot:m.231621 g.231621  ORF g.231621 m.231621 type:complete len:146 (-) comp54278_c1_seq15:165-602(-)